MRGPPALAVVCRGGSFWAALQWALPACALAGSLYWALQHLEIDAAAALLAAAGCAAAVGAALARRKMPPVHLQWDGQRWSADLLAVQPQVMIDFGSNWLLLRLNTAGAPRRWQRNRWVAVSEQDAGPLWPALRAAVYWAAAEPQAGPPSKPHP